MLQTHYTKWLFENDRFTQYWSGIPAFHVLKCR